MQPTMSIVMPAHNEEGLIDRTLSALLRDAAAGEFEVVVVANGCRDRTADRARAHSGVTVLELERGSKIAALNAGDAAVTTFPRAYIDADVTVGTEALRGLARALSADPAAPMVASPRMRVDTAASSWAVRQYYRIWGLTDFRQAGHIGSGIYAVSEKGRARFGTFPDVIADDRFVQQQFEMTERLTLPDEFTVESPRSIAALVGRGVRIAAGNRQLPSSMQRAVSDPLRQRVGNLVGRIVKNPTLYPAAVIYGVVTLAIRIRARRLVASGTVVGWNRDDTTRGTTDGDVQSTAPSD